MNKRKYITLKIPADEVDFFGAVLNCAVRYCIGRRTYMPGLVTDWIMKHCHGVLNAKTIGVMKRDIDEARTSPFGGLGDACDVVIWTKFREWLEKEGNNATD